MNKTAQAQASIDRGLAIRALETSTDAMATLLRYIGSTDVPIPHMTWTVAQCAVHQIVGDHMYAHQVVGPGASMTLEQTSDVNDWAVEPAAGLAPDSLAADLKGSTARFVEAVQSLPEDATFQWWSGSNASVNTAVALLVAERLMHGWDIARATGKAWTIPPAEAAVAVSGSVAVMPLLVDPDKARGFTATYEMRVRGGPRFELTFQDGTLTTRPVFWETRDVDCRISASAETILLVGYGRTSQWRAALTGRMLASGRKPWLGLRLARLLRAP